MDKAFLEGLSIPPEAIDKILEENSKEVGIEKEAYKKLKRSYDTDTANLKKEKSDFEFNQLLKEKLSDCKAKDIDVLKQLIKTDGLEVSDGDIKGLSEQIETLQKEKAFLFESEEQEKEPAFSKGIDSGGEASELSELALAMGIEK